jgi:hypothetical protein
MIFSLDGIPKADTVDIDGKQVTIDIRANGGGDGDEDDEEGPTEDNSEVIIDDTLLTRLTLRYASIPFIDDFVILLFFSFYLFLCLIYLFLLFFFYLLSLCYSLIYFE